jgi:hypothetical protein
MAKNDNKSTPALKVPVLNEAGEVIGEIEGALPAVNATWVSADTLVSGIVTESSEKEVVVAVISRVVQPATPPTSGAPPAAPAPAAAVPPKVKVKPDPKDAALTFTSKFDLRDPFQDLPVGKWFRTGVSTPSELTPWLVGQIEAKYVTQDGASA